jgi:hypothetical protein
VTDAGLEALAMKCYSSLRELSAFAIPSISPVGLLTIINACQKLTLLGVDSAAVKNEHICLNTYVQRLRRNIILPLFEES